jgi:hypothetical protein
VVFAAKDQEAGVAFVRRLLQHDGCGAEAHFQPLQQLGGNVDAQRLGDPMARHGDLQLLRLPDLFRIPDRAERRPGVRCGVYELAVLTRRPRDAIAQLGGARRFR